MRLFNSIRRPLGGFMVDPGELQAEAARAVEERFSRYIEHQLNIGFGRLTRRMEYIMASLDEVLMEVHAQRGKIDSLTALTAGIKKKLEDALAGVITPAIQAQIDSVFEDVRANTSAIAKAIDANDDDPNTPPVEPPAPVVTPAPPVDEPKNETQG
jgi:polyhydroxyalkanoate synthesis regulator phasin